MSVPFLFCLVISCLGALKVVVIVAGRTSRALFKDCAKVFYVAKAASLGNFLLRIILRFEQRNGIVDADRIEVALGACSIAFVKFSSQIGFADEKGCRDVGDG